MNLEKRGLINKCIDSIMNSQNDYGTLIREALEMYFVSSEFETIWHDFYEGSDNIPEKPMLDFSSETLDIAEARAYNTIASKFIEEVKRLLNSDAIDKEHHNRGLLFGIALENLADDYLRGERKTKEYKNLKRS